MSVLRERGRGRQSEFVDFVKFVNHRVWVNMQDFCEWRWKEPGAMGGLQIVLFRMSTDASCKQLIKAPAAPLPDRSSIKSSDCRISTARAFKTTAASRLRGLLFSLCNLYGGSVSFGLGPGDTIPSSQRAGP